MNLPQELHSHGLRRLAAVEAARGSFDATVEAIERNTGTRLAKRQAEELLECSAQEFDAFYDRPESAGAADITGARWSVRGAEAILRLRSLRSSRDFDDCWRFHLDAEHVWNQDHAARHAGKPTLRAIAGGASS